MKRGYCCLAMGVIVGENIFMAKKQTGKRKKVSSGDTRGEHPYLLPDFYDKNPDLKELAEKIAAK